MKVRVYQYPKPGYVLGIIGSALEKWIFKAYSWTRLFFFFFPHLKIFQETLISVFEICTSYFLLNFICFPFFVHCSLKDYAYILTSKLFWLIKVWSRCKYVLRLDYFLVVLLNADFAQSKISILPLPDVISLSIGC